MAKALIRFENPHGFQQPLINFPGSIS